MITLAPEAVADADRLIGFLNEVNPTASRLALKQIRSAIARLNDFPLLGVPTENDLIRQLVVRFGGAGYIVRYEVRADTGDVLVTRIWHSREARV